MYINYYETKDKYCSELSSFLDSDKDGVFYIGHASILVRLNNKKFIFDVIDNSNFYNRSWSWPGQFKRCGAGTDCQ